MAEIMKKPKPFGAVARETAQRFFRQENAILIMVLIALIGTMSVITKGLLTTRVNIMNILLQSSMRGVASVGQAFVILTAGIDISVGGIGLFCSVLGASLMTAGRGSIVGHPMSIYIAIPIMLLIGVGWGIINGSLVSRVGVPPLIVTLGMWEIAKGAAFQISGGLQIFELPEGLAFFGKGTVVGVAVPVIIFIAVVVIAYFVLYHTTFGKSVYAVGGNPVSAWLSGIKVKNTRFIVYVISGFLAGLVGVIFTGRVMSASMLSLTGLELDTIAAVSVGGVSLMGGRGSLIGAVIGVIMIGVINNGMSVLGSTPALQGILKGAIIITAVAIDYVRRR